MPEELVGWPGDFHWVRCDNTWIKEQWIWSHKDGTDQMTKFDIYAGNYIYAPEAAHWIVHEGPL